MAESERQCAPNAHAWVVLPRAERWRCGAERSGATVANARGFYPPYGDRWNHDHRVEAGAQRSMDLSLPHPDPYIAGNVSLSSREHARPIPEGRAPEPHGGPRHGDYNRRTQWHTGS